VSGAAFSAFFARIVQLGPSSEVFRLKFFKKLGQAVLVAAIKWGEAGSRLASYRERRRFHWLPNLFIFLILVLLIADYFRNSGVLTWLSSLEGMAAYEFWIGTKSVLEVALGLTTTLIAVTAAYLALRSYRVNQRAAVANRYQKGVELLGASADSSKLGGIELLSIVAREAPEEYQEPVMRTLRYFLQERCAAAVEATGEAGSDPRALPATDSVVIAALSAVTRTPWRLRWLELESDAEGLTLRGVYLHNVRILKADFRRITFDDGAFGDVSFESCNLAETFIIGRFFGSVTFNDCSISNSEILAADMCGAPLEDPKSYICISPSSQTSGFGANGQSLQAPKRKDLQAI
jgi:hypothetical protein